MNFTKIISSSIEASKRLVKVIRYGREDTRSTVQVSPFGFDSAPQKDMIAVFGPMGTNGESAIIGYINRNHIAAAGESRQFSEDGSGNVVMYLHMKADGTAEFNGNADFMVRYSALETAFNQLKDDHNSLAQKWDTFATAYVPGSPTVTGLPATATTAGQSSADITGAKIEEIKTS